MNYYPFHIGDYASATRHLSWEEDCAYRRLLDVYYTTEKPLPLDIRAVCRLVLATTETQREAVSQVLQEFFVKSDDGWINSRADLEIEAMQAKQQKQRDKANKRWHKPETEPGIAAASDLHAAASNEHAVAMPPTPTPTPTPTPKDKTKTRAVALVVDEPIPDDIPGEPWTEFIAHRKAMRGVPFTEGAKKGVLRDLRALVARGYDATDLLQTAVTRGWRTVFEPKGNPSGSGGLSAAGANTARNADELRKKLFSECQ